jgi:hypothetical protein
VESPSAGFGRVALVAGVLVIGGATSWHAQAPAQPINLNDLSNWQLVAESTVSVAEICDVRPGGVIAVSGKPVGYLASTRSFKNFRLHAEWRWPLSPGNGGVLVHIGSGPKDRQWPMSFQVQLKHGAVGDLLPMAGAAFAERLSTPPEAKTPQLNHAAPDSERQVGEWNTCDIICLGDSIEVVINGVAQNRVTRCSRGEGPVGFQLEGTPFELRSITLTPIPTPS